MAFDDNQTITASDLNNIAVDLGATTFSNFADTDTFAVDDLNDITSALVGKGITKYGNKCNLTKQGTNAVVDTGLIIFGNGAKIKITSPVSIGLISDATTYIYAQYNVQTQHAELIASETEPMDSGLINVVKIGNIDSSGVVNSTREFASLKVQNPATQNYQKIERFKIIRPPASRGIGIVVEFELESEYFINLVVSAGTGQYYNNWIRMLDLTQPDQYTDFTNGVKAEKIGNILRFVTIPAGSSNTYYYIEGYVF